MFKSIKIKNLRSITELEIDNLGQVNLLVGQNGCGKTTVLESLFLLIGATNPNLPLTINNLRGLNAVSNELWPTYFHNMIDETPIEITGELYDTDEIQNLSIYSKKDQEIVTKPVTSDIVKIENSDSEISFDTNGLKLEYKNSKTPDEVTTSSIFFKNGKIETQGYKEPPVRVYFKNPSMASDWKNEFAQVQRRKKVQDVVSLLREVDSRLSDLRINEIGLLETDIGLHKLIPANLLGGGINKYLSVSSAMVNYENGMVLIDEFENGLHYSAQENLWKAVFSWSQKLNVQFFATTHSYECIKAFSSAIEDSLFKSEAKLYRIERKDDSFKTIEFDAATLSRFVEKVWEMR